MPLTLNQRLYDMAVAHQVGVLRFASRTAKRVLSHVNSVEKDVVRRLRDGPTELGRVRLEALLASLRVVYDAGYEQASADLVSDALDLAEYEVEYQAEHMTRAISLFLPVRVEIAMPSPIQVRAAVEARPFQGRLLREAANHMAEGAFERTKEQIRIGFTEGETTDTVVKRIRGTEAARHKDGVTEISRRGAESLVRTAMNHTANYARELTYAENEDLVDKVRWVSTLDGRTTPVCRSRDGKVYPVGSGPRPPAHWGCRSTTVPVVKSFAELGFDLPELPASTRASVDGQVPATETYQTWLARQSAATQDDILGPTRAALYRDGGMDVDRFVDSTGRQYTLEELRRRDRAAFEATGLATK